MIKNPSKEIRDLRLWFWRRMLKYRDKSNIFMIKCGNGCDEKQIHIIKQMQNKSNHAMRSVQALNELFEIDDTAGNDWNLFNISQDK